MGSYIQPNWKVRLRDGTTCKDVEIVLGITLARAASALKSWAQVNFRFLPVGYE